LTATSESMAPFLKTDSKAENVLYKMCDVTEFGFKFAEIFVFKSCSPGSDTLQNSERNQSRCLFKPNFGPG
jgi:hypothetical protein